MEQFVIQNAMCQKVDKDNTVSSRRSSYLIGCSLKCNIRTRAFWQLCKAVEKFEL